MIKIFTFFFIFIIGATSTTDEMVRWGQNGHRTTALIAEQYLNDNAAAEVKRILGEDTMAEVLDG